MQDHAKTTEKLFEKINKATLKFLKPYTTEKLYKLIANEAKRLVSADYGSIFLFKNEELQRIYASDPLLYEMKIQPRGLVYQSFRENKAFAVGIDKVPYINSKIIELGLKSIIIIPVSYRKKTLGVLTVLSKKEAKFTNRQLDVLKLFGSMASLAIRKTYLYNKSNQVLKDKNKYKNLEHILEQIHTASLKFLLPLAPQETYATIVQEAKKLVEGDDGFIVLVENNVFKKVYASSQSATLAPIRRKGFTYKVFNKRHPLVVSLKELKKVHPQIVKSGIKSSLLLPLYYEKESIGVLFIRYYKDKSFSQEELKILNLFGSMATMAIRKTQLYDEAKKAVEIRDLFISMAAHELRTPLTTISGYVQLLQKRLGEHDSIEAKWARELFWESRRLSQLINELLEMNRIKTGQFHYIWKECLLSDIISRALNNFRTMYPERKITFKSYSHDSMDNVIGDFDKLLQAISSVIENALKFSSSKEEVSLTLHAKPSDVRILVLDKGTGIKKEDMPHLFKEFYKGPSQEEGGMGLGLFLAKNIIRQHHGSITIHSKEGSGTSVEIMLPRAKV